MSAAPDIIQSFLQVACFAVLNRETRVLDVSDALLALMGRQRTEISGKPFLKVFASERARGDSDWLFSRIKSGFPWRGDFLHMAPNGNSVWIDATLIPILESNGEWKDIHVIAFDISERKRLEAAQKRSLRGFENILNTAPSGIFIADKNGECSFVNQAWMRNAGCGLVEALSDAWFNRIHPQDVESVFEDWNHFIAGRRPFAREFRYRRDGDECTVYARADHLDGPDGHAIIRIEENITPLREHEKRVNSQRAEQFESIKLSSLFNMAGNVAHEINNPAAIIKARSDQILRLVASVPVDVRRVELSAKAISDTVDRIANVIRSLIQITQGGSEDAQENVTVSALFDSLSRLYTGSYAERGVRLEIVPPEESLHLVGSSSALGQMLAQLLANAFDAIEARDGAWIRLSARRVDRQVEIQIQDSGFGIPASTRTRIFEPFFTTKDTGKGMGLGLCIARSIAEKHRGKLVLCPDLGHTTFHITLPLNKESAFEHHKTQ